MKFYPVYLDLRERPCLIVGGGRVAERKALSLLETGADVRIVSPTLTPKLQELCRSGKISHTAKLFEDKDITGAFLVIAATDFPGVNSGIGKLCRKKQVLVNVAAPPEESSFIVPSVLERGDLVIAVSTSGSSPALARKIREELQNCYGPEYDLFLQKMALLRDRLMEEVPDEPARRRIFEAVVDSDVLGLLKQGKVHEADRRIADISGPKKQ